METVGRADRHIVGLDLLRFVAALMVVALHVWASTTKPESHVGHLAQSISGTAPYMVREAAPALTYLGFIGVPIFFTVSGFVIAFSAQRQSVASFIRSRWTRLIPMLWIATVIGALIQVLALKVPLLAVLAPLVRSMLLLPLGPYIDGVVWTLVIEVAFYAMIAVWIILDAKRRFHLLAIIIGILAALYWALYFGAGCEGSFVTVRTEVCVFVENRWFNKAAELSMLTYGGFFATGVLLCWGWSQTRMAAAMLFSTPAVFAAACQIIVSVRWMTSHYGSQGAMDDWGLAVAFWLGGVGWIWLSLRLNTAWQLAPQGVLVFIRQTGLATYPLYLIHSLTGGVLLGVALRLGADVVTALLLTTVGVIAGAYVLAIWVEPPARRVLTKLYDSVAAKFKVVERSRASLGF